MGQKTENFIIEEANLEDIPQIVEFRRALFKEMGVPDSSFVEDVYGVVAKYYTEEFTKGSIRHFIAYDGKLPVAIAGALIKNDFPYYLFKPGYYGWIIDVYTKPGYRGRQLASRLIEETHRWLTDKGIWEAKLIASGSEARRLYDKLGYRATWEMSLNLSGGSTFNEYIDQRGDGEGI